MTLSKYSVSLCPAFATFAASANIPCCIFEEINSPDFHVTQWLFFLSTTI